ncbi:MAG: photosystem II repair protein Psb32 [Pseudanabaenaceae cyanobacterium]|jgi:uncharacterized protein
MKKTLKTSLISLTKWWGQVMALVMSLTLVWGCWATPAFAIAVSDIPELAEVQQLAGQTWVLDDAEVLNTLTETNLKKQIATLADTTQNQVHVVTVRRIDFGQPIEEFTQELFIKWFPNTALAANQLLVVVATEDHRTALYGGAKVGETLTDALSQSIANTNMLLPARKGNFNQAVTDGVERITAILSGAPDPGEPVVVQESGTTSNYATAEETKKNGGISIGWVIGLLTAATVIPMVTYYWFQNQP